MDWANELEEMKKMSDNEYKMYYYHRFGVDNQIISAVLFCIVFLIIGGFITCSYGQISKISRTAIERVIDKNVAKTVVEKEITDGFLKQREIPHSNDFQQMYKNDTTLKGTAILPQTSQIEIEKKKEEHRKFMNHIKKMSNSLISETKSERRQHEYQSYLIKGVQCLQNKDSLQAIHHFLSADSVIQRHPDILNDKTLSKCHSQILFRLGWFYFTDKNSKSPEHLEKTLYYFERAEALGNTDAGILANSIRTIYPIFKKGTEEKNCNTNNKD